MRFYKKITILVLLFLAPFVQVVRAEVFFKDRVLDGVHLSSFEALGDGYAKDKNFIYFSWVGVMREADVDTFKILGHSYAKDKKNIYYKGFIVDGASPESFQIVNGEYSKDLEDVFYAGKKLEASLAGFEVFDKYYARDFKRVFFEGEVIEGVDYNSFVELGDNYAKDKSKVYYKGRVLSSAYTDSFELIGNEYAKDSYAVYGQGLIVQEVDVENSRMFDENLLQDNNYIYSLGSNYKNIKIKKDGFEKLGNYFYKDKDGRVYSFHYMMLLETKLDATGIEFVNDYYVKSNDLVYYMSHRLVDVDFDSFVALGINFARDKSNVFYNNSVVKGAGTSDVKVMAGNYLKTINEKLYDNLRGKIILKVEDWGKAYYVHYKENEIHYLGRPEDAFAVMREQGIGIATKDLAKIPIGLVEINGEDKDGDGLSDLLEEAIGSNINSKDTDGDTYSDYDEVKSGFSLYGGGRENYDNNFAVKQKGKIFLQVEDNGEAWYVNPIDSKRYFLGRPVDAFSIMRELGLGISNENFEKL